MKWWQHIYYSIRNGEWSAGVATRKTWPGKPYLGFIFAYYDGNHWGLHFGPAYIGCSYY